MCKIQNGIMKRESQGYCLEDFGRSRGVAKNGKKRSPLKTNVKPLFRYIFLKAV